MKEAIVDLIMKIGMANAAIGGVTAFCEMRDLAQEAPIIIRVWAGLPLIVIGAVLSPVYIPCMIISYISK